MSDPGRKINVPRGIELLLKKAAVDPEFRQLLLEKRAEAAKTIGLELRPSEIEMLTNIPKEHLEAIISQTKVDSKLRPILMGTVAAVMLVALAGILIPTVTTTLGVRPDHHPRAPHPTPENPPADDETADTNSAAPSSVPADTNPVNSSKTPIMSGYGGVRPDRPPSIPATTTSGSPETTSAPAVAPTAPADTDAVLTPVTPPPRLYGGVRPDRP